MKNVIKSVGIVLCLAVCAAFALMGCNDDTYTNEDDYANFVKWQARYETEKELVELLREYDEKYTSFVSENSELFYDGKNYAPKDFVDTTIVFTFNDGTVLEDYIISIRDPKTLSSGYYGFMVSRNYDTQPLLATIHDNQVEIIDAMYPWVADDMEFCKTSDPYFKILYTAKFIEQELQQSAKAYNEKRSTCKHEATYLPNSLSETYEYTNVSSYLENAEAFGF